MNCYFCQKICRPVASGKTDGFPVHLGYVSRVWQCDYHGAVAVKHYEGSGYTVPLTGTDQISHWATKMRWLYKENVYAAIIYHDGRGKPFGVYKDKKSPLGILQVVFELEFIPEVTPETLDKKLPIYMVFA